MDVSSFLGGSWLTHQDLPAQSQQWTIREVSQQLVGGQDLEICVKFDQHARSGETFSAADPTETQPSRQAAATKELKTSFMM